MDIAELVERVKKKDMLAMNMLYQNSVKAMMTLSCRITRNRTDSEDILQESYLTSFQQISKLDNPSRYYSWLKRIVVNNSLQAIKGKRHYEEIEQLKVEAEEEEDHWYKRVPFAKIKLAIDELPDGCREIFTLYLLEGFKHQEVAEKLNIALSTSKSQYRYALKLLKEKLIKYS